MASCPSSLFGKCENTVLVQCDGFVGKRRSLFDNESSMNEDIIILSRTNTAQQQD